MNFDFLSFIIGFLPMYAGAKLQLLSEDKSLANRIAYNLMCDAQKTIKLKYIQEHKNIWQEYAELKSDSANLNNKSPKLDIFDEAEIDEEKIYPIEDENFMIQKVPALRVQTDVNIAEYLGVYSKQYDMWFLIEEDYDCENIRKKYRFYKSNSNFEKIYTKLIHEPADFDLAKYLK